MRFILKLETLAQGFFLVLLGRKHIDNNIEKAYIIPTYLLYTNIISIALMPHQKVFLLNVISWDFINDKYETVYHTWYHPG